MKSQLTDEFIALFRVLPAAVQTQARRAYRRWRDNPAHPGLMFKKLTGTDSIYSVRVSLGWRVVGLLEGDTVTWFWIGSHAEYDRLVDSL